MATEYTLYFSIGNIRNSNFACNLAKQNEQYMPTTSFMILKNCKKQIDNTTAYDSKILTLFF